MNLNMVLFLTTVVPTFVYIIYKTIKVRIKVYEKNNDKFYYTYDYGTYDFDCKKSCVFKCNFTSFITKYEVSSFKELCEYVKYISDNRTEIYKEIQYTLENMFNHLKYTYEEDKDNFISECRKHNEELLQPIVNKIKEEERIAEEKLKKEKQKIINKEKEEYDFQYNACKEILLDKLELGKVEVKKTNIAKVNLKKDIDDYLEKVDENVINRNNQEYNNICKEIERDYYMHTGKKLQRRVGFGCEIRGGYGDKILSYSEDDKIIKLKTKILEEDKRLKYLEEHIDIIDNNKHSMYISKLETDKMVLEMELKSDIRKYEELLRKL